MKEINDIIRAYETALANNQRMALATVVKVEGSSYRQPGARMLVTEDGRLTGAISGGCLEGDALRKALLAMHQQKNKLITYDTTGEGGSEFGVQLGCNGIVHILFEPIDIHDPNNPVALLERLQQNRRDAVVVTLFSTEDRNAPIGTVLLANDADDHFTAPSNIDLSPLTADIRLAKDSRQSFLKEVLLQDIPMEALIEYRAPSVHLVIAGAGNDARPLVEMADILGWEVTVVDGRATHAVPQRFPRANRVLLATPERVREQTDIDPLTVFVLMTHNYHYDLSLLKTLLSTPAPYIGVLGPKTKMERMFSDLAESGVCIDESQRERIFGPMGLDIGAETSDEIAVSVISEIKAVLSGRKGSSLRLLTTKIHDDIPTMR